MPRLIELYTVNKKQIKSSLHHLKWFMRYCIPEDVTYTIEEDIYIVLHDPETGDMCHLYNHPRIIRAVHDYGIMYGEPNTEHHQP